MDYIQEDALTASLSVIETEYQVCDRGLTEEYRFHLCAVQYSLLDETMK